MSDAREMRKVALERELRRIVDILIHQRHPHRIILFGSMARGEVHEWSDIDLAVVLDTDKRIYDRIGELLEICDPHLAVEFIVYTPEEFEEMAANEPFVRREIIERGRVLYEAA